MNKAFQFFAIVSCVFATGYPALAKPAILGYSAAWRDEASPPSTYDLNNVTHIARAFLHPKSDGSLVVPDGYFDPKFEKLAHEHHVKLLLSLGGGSDGAKGWISLATDPASRKKLLDRLGELMQQHGYDGVDVDWEPMPETAADGQAYTGLLKAIRAQFPKAVITTALDDWVTTISWPDVISSVDYINVMTYDYTGAWTGKAGHGTNLHPPGDYPPVAGHSAEEGMHKLIDLDHLPPAKLLLGMNFWAYRYRTDKLGGTFAKNDEKQSDALTYQQV